jgi:hypothetical protein
MPTVRAQNDTIQLEAVIDGASRAVTGELRFPPKSRATSVTVSLALFANVPNAELAENPERIDAETPIAGCTTKVARGEDDEAVSFELPLPPAAVSYAGTAFTIHVGLVASPDQGPTLRVFVDPPPSTEGQHAVLRGLPKEQSLARPAPFFTAVVMTLAGAALVGLASARDLLLPGQIGFAVLGVGVVLAFVFRRGALGWLRVGNPTTRLEAQADAMLAIVRGSSRVSGGKARVVATEYEHYDGSTREVREIASRSAPLERAADGSWTARVPLPAPGEAPPSLALRGPKRLAAIRWVAKLELTNPRGRTAHAVIPIHMGRQPDA